MLSMSEREFRNRVEKLLKTCKLLPLSNWKSFELSHEDSVNEQRTYETIRNKMKKIMVFTFTRKTENAFTSEKENRCSAELRVTM